MDPTGRCRSSRCGTQRPAPDPETRVVSQHLTQYSAPSREPSRRDFVIAALGAITGVATGAGAANSLDSLRARIEASIIAGHACGVAVALVQGGVIVWEEGFGWADRARRLRATAHTPFCLASLTKPFTATTLMRLVADARLSLEDSIDRYVHAGRRPKATASFASASVAELGAHVAGFPSTFEMYPYREGLRAPRFRQLLERYGATVYPPGEIYEYSNIGYAVLGDIAEQITSRPFADVLRTEVLEPLGLDDSFYGSDQAHRHVAATRYDELGRPIPNYATSTPPSGELYASAHDVARFALFNLNHRLGSRPPLLPEELVERMHRALYFGASGGASTFGWFTGRTRAGVPIVFKDGGQPGVSTLLCLIPSMDLACVVLANRTGNGDLAMEIVNQAIGTIVPGWETPDASIRERRRAFVHSTALEGHWRGHLWGDGIDDGVAFRVESGSRVTLSIGSRPATKMTGLTLRDAAIVGLTNGALGADDVLRNNATRLSLKLLPRGNKLAGRILASAEYPGRLATLPFALSLSRA